MLETGAGINISTTSGAAVGQIVFTTGAWYCEISNLASGLNKFTVTAVDQAGNTVSEEVATIYMPPLSISMASSSITSSYQDGLGITISNITPSGSEALIEQFVDANQNGVIDAGDYVVRSIKVIDGTASANPNVQGDEDGVANSSITTSLNYYLLNDLYHAPGHYLFRVTSGADSASTPFVVTSESQLQSISGTVIANGSPLPGAIVMLSDKWQRPMAYTLADETGKYTLYLKSAGDYLVSSISFGYSWNTVQPPVAVITGLPVTGYDLTLVPGAFHLSGSLKDAATGAGINGIWVKADSTDNKSAAITGADGSYNLALAAGNYTITPTADPTVPNPSNKGYLAFDNQSVAANVTADGTVADITLPFAEFTVNGKVVDGNGVAIPGIPIQAKISGSYDVREPVGYGVTNGNGEYTLTIGAGDNWNISLQDLSAQSLGYIGTAIGSISTSSSPLAGNDLTAYPITAWVQGTVKDSNDNLIKGGDIRLRNADSSVVSSIVTVSDGTYRIGAFAGNWLVNDITHNQLNQTLEQTVSLTDSQFSTVDFVVDVTPPTLAINPVMTPATSNFQTITGTIESGSIVAITINTAASVGQVSYPTQTTWNCTISDMEEGTNTVTVTAIDVAGNQTQKTAQIVYTALIAPDLTIIAVIPPAATATGQQITVPVTVKNQGTGSSGGFYVSLYLSTDGAITTSDASLGQQYVSSLAVGAQQTLNFTVKVPAVTAGTYHIGAIADVYNSVAESSETNNSLAGSPTPISN